MTSPAHRAYDAYTREERSERQFARRTSAVIAATVVAAIVTWVVAWAILAGVHSWLDVLVLAAVAAVSNIRRRQYSDGRGLSLGGAIMLAAIPLGAGPGIPLISLLSALAAWRSHRPEQILFNASAGATSGLLAALVYQATGEPILPDSQIVQAGLSAVAPVALGLVFALVVQALVVGGLVSAVLWASRGVSVRASLLELISESGLVYLATGGLALLIYFTWGPAGVGPLAVVLLLPTFVASQLTVSQWGNERAARSRVVSALTTAMDERHPGAAARAADVARVAEWVADELNMNPVEAHHLRLAGALHGIDELTIADPAGSAKRHAATALAAVDFLVPALTVIERSTESAEQADVPPRSARVLAVADAYARLRAVDASDTSSRAKDAAFAALRDDSAQHFDPVVVAALGRVLTRVDPIVHHPPPATELGRVAERGRG